MSFARPWFLLLLLLPLAWWWWRRTRHKPGTTYSDLKTRNRQMMNMHRQANLHRMSPAKW